MNKVYKTVWNEATQSWVAVSELDASKGKRNSCRVSAPAAVHAVAIALKASVAALLLAFPLTASATVAIDTMARGYAVNNGTARTSGTGGDRALAYGNPGNLSYEDPSQARVGSNLYSPDDAATGIAIGRYSDAVTEGARTVSGIAIGDYARAVGGLGIALGGYSQATNIGSAAIGTGALASGFNSLSMMRQSAATNDYAMAIGNVSWAAGKGSLAMGQSSTALGNQSIAIGSADVSATASGGGVNVTNYDASTGTRAEADFAVAIGAQGKATAESATAIGTKVLASGSKSVAVGSSANASAANALAMGSDAVASNTSSTAIGSNAQAAGQNSFAAGVGSRATQTSSVAIGNAAIASDQSATAIGRSATATTSGGIAIGSGAQALATGAPIAIGQNAVVAATNNNGIAIGTSTGTNAISGTDNSTVGRLAGRYVSGNTNYVFGNNAGNFVTGHDNYAQGISGGRYVQGSQNVSVGYHVGQAVVGTANINMGYQNSSADASVTLPTAAGSTAEVTGGQRVFGNNNLILGRDAGRNIGVGTLTVNNTGLLTGRTTTASSDNVILGTRANQFTTANALTTSNNVAIGTDSKASGGNAVAQGTQAVASGASSIAVGNGAQATGTQALSIGTGNVVSGNNSGAIGDPNTVTGDGSYALGNNNTISGNNTFVVGNDVAATAANNVILGNASSESSATTTSGAPNQVSSATVGKLSYSGFAGTASGVASVGAAGKERQIINVAPGAITAASTDAINGSQLYATNEVIDKVANSTVNVLGGDAAVDNAGNITMSNIGGTGATNIHDAIAAAKTEVEAGDNIEVTETAGADGQTVYTVATAKDLVVDSVTAGNTTINTNGLSITGGPSITTTGIDAAGTAITNVAAGTADTDAVNVAQLNETAAAAKTEVEAGDNIEVTETVGADGQAVYTVATAKDLVVDSVTAGNTVLNNAGVTIGSGADAVSLTAGGLDNGGNVISNVGQGVAGTDAVNVDQLTTAIDAIDSYAGWSLSTNGGAAEAVAENTTVDLSNTDGNLTLTQTGTNVEFGLANTLSVGTANPISINGDAGTVGGLTNTTFDANNYVSGQAATEDQLADVAGDVATNAGNIATNTTAIAGNAAEIAKGINVGDGNTDNTYALGDTINITEADSNIVTTTTADGVSVGLGDNINVSSVTAGNTTINTDGLSITGGPSVTSSGIDAAGTAITNVAAGTADTDAVNVAQLTDAIKAVDGYSGWNLRTNGGTAAPIAENTTVDLNNTDGNITLTQTGTNVEFGLANTLSVGTANPVSINGDAGTVGGLTNTTFDPKNYVSGQAATEDQLAGVAGDVETNAGNIATNTTAIATNATEIAKGLNFSADSGTPVNRKLGDTVAITGDDNIQTETTTSGVQVKLNNNLNLTDTGSVTMGDTVLNNNGMTIANGPSVTSSGIDAGGKQITNVASGGVVDTNAANIGDVKAAAAAAKSEVKAGTNVASVDVSNGNDGQTIYTVNADGAKASAGSAAVTVTAGAKDADNVTDYQVDLSDASKASLANADSALQEVVTQIDGQAVKTLKKDDNTANFITGDNIELTADNDGIKIATAKDVSFESVTIGDGTNSTKLTGTADGLDVGGDKITNVAAGDINANSTDAVNGSQLYATNQNVANNTTVIDKGLNFSADSGTPVNSQLGDTVAITGDDNIQTETTTSGVQVKLNNNLNLTDTGSVTMGDTVLNNNGMTIANGPSVTSSGIDAGGKQITNVASGGVVDTNAANIGDVKAAAAAAKSEVKAGTNVASVDVSNGNDGQTIYTVNADGAKASAGSAAVTVTAGAKDADNVTDYQVDLSDASKASLANADSALQEVVTQIDGQAVKTLKKDDNTANFITGDNIELTADNDGIKIATAKDVSFESVTIGDGTNSTKLTGTADGLDVGGDKITNVAAGDINANSTDAVNGSQLYATNQNVANNTTVIDKGLNFSADSGTPVNSQLGDTVAITGDDNIQTETTTSGVQVKLNNNLNLTDTGSVTMGDTVLNNNGMTIANGPSVTSSGIDAGGKQITNVASGGVVDTNAANIGDVKAAAAAAKSEVKAGTNVASVDVSNGNDGQTIYTVNADGAKASAGSAAVTVTAGAKDADNVTDYQVDLSDASKASLANADSALQEVVTQIDGQAVKTLKKDDNTANFITGDNIELTADNDGIKIATAKDVSFESVTIGDGTNSTKLTGTADGLDVGGDKITNVAAGDINANSTDAVNGSQLYATNQNVANNTTVIDKGLNFSADSGTPVNSQLGDTVAITGDDNIQTETTTSGVQVKLNNNLNLTDTGSVTMGDTVLNNNGMTIANGPSVTSSGIDAGGKQITNVASGGVVDTNAANIGDVKAAAAAAKSEVKAGTNVASVDVSNGNDGQTIYTVNADGAKASAGSAAVTVTAGAKDADNVTDYQVDLSDASKASLANADSALQEVVTQIDGQAVKTLKKDDNTANFITGDNIELTADNDGIKIATAKDVSFESVTIGDGTNSTKLTGTADGLDVGGDKITNVAAGDINANSTDAVNGSQLYATNQNVANNTTVIDKGLNFSADSGTPVNSQLGDTVAITGDDNIQTETTTSGVQVKLNNNLNLTDTGSVTMGDTVLNNNGMTIANGPSVTSSGIDAGGKQITNVASGGVVDTNAANIGDVKAAAAAAKSEVKAGTNVASVDVSNGNDGQTIYTVNADGAKASAGSAAVTVTAGAKDADNVTDYQVDLSDASKASLANADSALQEVVTQIDGQAVKTLKKDDNTANFITGDNIELTADNDGIKIATAKDVSFESVTIGDGTNSTKLTGTADGLDVGGDKITNVAAGDINANSTDAVNGSQLYATNQNVANNTTVIDKGLNFSADSGTPVNRKLGDTVAITGDDNIQTETTTSGVQVKLNNNLNLTDTGSVTMGDTVLNNNGMTIANGPSVTSSGIDAGGKQITNVASGGVVDTNAANIGDVKAAAAAAKSEVKAGTNVASVDVSNGNDGQTIYTVNADGAKASAGSAAVTVTAGAKDADNVTDYQVDLSDASKASLANADSALQEVVTQIDGQAVKTLKKDDNTANFITGDNIELTADNDGIKIATAKDVSFESVTIGDGTNSTKLTGTADGLDVGGDKITNVAAGDINANSTDAVNGSQLYATNQNVANNTTVIDKGLNFSADSGTPVNRKLGDTVAITGDDNIQTETTTSGVQVKLNNNLNLTDTGSVTMGDTVLNNNGMTIANGPSVTSSGIDAGSKQITNVASGGDVVTNAANIGDVKAAAAAAKSKVEAGDNIKVTSSTGADGQTVYEVATADDLEVDSVKAGDTVLNRDGVKVGDDVALTKDGLTAGDTKVNNDGVSVGDKVALDKDGLSVGDVSVTENGLDNGGNKITNVAAGTDDTDAVNVSQLKAAQAASTTKVAAGDNIEVTTAANTDGSTTYTVATAKDLNVDSVKAGDTTVNNDGVSIKDGPSITKDGIDVAGNKVSNVAAGDISATSTDAVNGSQLYTTNQSVAENTAAIGKGLNFSADSGNTVNRKLGDTVAITGDSNIKTATTSDGVQVTLNKDLTVDSVTAGNTVVNNDGVKVGDVALTEGGLDNGGNTIQNVGAGVNGTDAVNVNQLQGLSNNIASRIEGVENKANAGTAAAMAVAGLPQAYLPGKSMVAIAGGVYRGESGYALGFSSISDGGNWVIKGTASGNSRGHYGATAGVGYQW